MIINKYLVQLPIRKHARYIYILLYDQSLTIISSSIIYDELTWFKCLGMNKSVQTEASL